MVDNVYRLDNLYMLNNLYILDNLHLLQSCAVTGDQHEGDFVSR